MDEKDLTIQELRAKNKKITEELKQLKKQRAAVDMDKLTKEMMEHICDNLCKHPIRVGQTQDELDDICAECKMGKFVCDILNTYNHKAKQVEEIKESELDPIEMCKVAIALDRLKEYQRLEEQGLLLELPCKVGTQVFIINHYWIDEGFICGIAEADDIDCFCFKVYEEPDTYTLIAIDDFKKGWFLTEQEAQAALEKMKGE